MACFYPGDETYRKLARCIDDPQYGPYWQATYALDRLECGLSGNIVKVIELGADALACSERETKPCDPQGLVTPQELLNDQFNKLVQKCGGLPNETSLEVRFTDGCATELRERGIDDDAARLSCIQQALDAVHFACADGLDCAAMEVSTLQ
ncbi:hypothetical protein AKJ09_01648 [Labilithrix luteola]|uniref:Uncharacterized protein n=2 Tax=Labilithrix luteola TaxID=1391654 RepID=A0A0K1PPD4_9BACT|nr:hypothetical protein AKJ09_01648 [Labilithrix luteola]